MPSEIQARAAFDTIRYAQVWEDADLLVAGLRPGPGKTFLSIASAGDNALALLASAPERVWAVDLNPAQIRCLEMRVAAYRSLSHPELLEFMGSRPSPRRSALYHRCRLALSPEARTFWDTRQGDLEGGLGGVGKFEAYFRLFRTRIVPLVHRRATVARLLEGGPRERRQAFYEDHWDTWRWRLLFRLFFSRAVMGRLGRDPEFFRYVEGSVADRILERTRHALVDLDPADNPYLHWILTGTHGEALPFALREASFEAIRANLDRLTWRLAPLEDVLQEVGPRAVDGFNLSDIFEYMGTGATEQLLERLAGAGRPWARLAYWNMLAPRQRPDRLAHRLRPLAREAQALFQQDKAWFYSAFVLEEVLP